MDEQPRHHRGNQGDSRLHQTSAVASPKTRTQSGARCGSGSVLAAMAPSIDADDFDVKAFVVD